MDRFLVSLHGDAWVLLLTEGTEVHFPPHLFPLTVGRVGCAGEDGNFSLSFARRGDQASGLARESINKRSDRDMNKDRLAGAAKQAKGAIKEVAGKMLGNPELVAEGKVDKLEGYTQSVIGHGKDALQR